MATNEDLVLIILALFVPFVSVAIKRGFGSPFWINLLLTLLLFHLPGVIHGIYVILHSPEEDAIKVGGISQGYPSHQDAYEAGRASARAEQEGYKGGYSQTAGVETSEYPSHQYAQQPSQQAPERRPVPSSEPAYQSNPYQASQPSDVPPTYPAEKK